MHSSLDYLNASAAARRLGVSTKALRLYEQRGLLHPGRSAAGYRVYGPAHMLRAADIVALRALGLGLAELGRVLDAGSQSLSAALGAHQTLLENDIRELVGKLQRCRALRTDLARGAQPREAELATRLRRTRARAVAFELPWPWDGESFELHDIRPLNYIIGPLGSGKTRLARRLAETIPNAAYLGLERLQEGATSTADTRVAQTLLWLIEQGATSSPALTALLTGLHADGADAVVVDMVEQGLDQATQRALIAHLRRCARDSARPLFLMTRSSAIVELSDIGQQEMIIFCPANHAAPHCVLAYAGAPGYEAVATCLAPPEVRARVATPPRVN